MTTTEKMLQKLPGMVIRLESSNPVKKRHPDSRNSGYGLRRPPCLEISFSDAIRPRLVSLVNVTIDERSGSGVFSKGYTSYLVNVRMFPMGGIPSSRESMESVIIQCMERKRYSDFVTFHAELEKRFPLSILPPLPPKSPGAAVAEKRKGESIPEIRQRALRLWLQHVLLHGSFHRYHATREFVTGVSTAKAKGNRESLGGWEVDGDFRSSGSGSGSGGAKREVGDGGGNTDASEDSDLLYEGFLESDSLKNSRSSSTAAYEARRDALSEAVKYKCQQDKHSVAR